MDDFTRFLLNKITLKRLTYATLKEKDPGKGQKDKPKERDGGREQNEPERPMRNERINRSCKGDTNLTSLGSSNGY